ncbi:MAG TPA: HAD-IA family hydrolase [Verrucomicrobiae bacterium]|nr:HAD-IA family hydrolase [Verrucomicrobiae bacterium]
MKPRPPITAVTFDVGGTLIEPWPSVGHVYAEVATRWGLAGVTAEALNRGFAAAWQVRRPFDHSRAAWQRLVNQTFAAAGATRPSDACFGAIYRRFAETSAWRVFDDAQPALEALAARGLRLGIVSNWDERLRPLLARLGLAKYFRASIISCEAGHLKPDPEIFARAAAELGCEPAVLIHVGDSVQEDAEGARAAGMRAVLIDRSGRHGRHGKAESAGSADGPPPHVGGYGVISSLRALPASLDAAGTNGNLDYQPGPVSR